MPAKPPPTIKTRFLPGTAFVTGGFSCGNDLVRIVVMDVPTISRASRPISIGYSGASDYSWTALRCIERLCLIMRGRHYALEQHAREDQPEGHGHDDQKCGRRSWRCLSAEPPGRSARSRLIRRGPSRR